MCAAAEPCRPSGLRPPLPGAAPRPGPAGEEAAAGRAPADERRGGLQPPGGSAAGRAPPPIQPALLPRCRHPVGGPVTDYNDRHALRGGAPLRPAQGCRAARRDS